MKVLLLGVGMQGKAALDDLVGSEGIEQVIVADQDRDKLEAYVAERGYGERVQCEELDASDPASFDRLFVLGPQVAIDLLPIQFIPNAVSAAVRHGVHFVNTYYPPAEMRALAGEAEARGITILPEFGMDPGIDLLLLGKALNTFEQLDDIMMYGAGIPDWASADNPIHYKVSWILKGALNFYRQLARVIRGGARVTIGETELFAPENIHHVEIEDLGRFEAFANGDVIADFDSLGIACENLQNVGRFTLRWPGHAEFWKKIVDLHLLDDEPVRLNGTLIDRKEYLAAALEPHLLYAPGEVDLAIVRIEARGRIAGEPRSAVYQMIDRLDPLTGFSGMSRTVGYTASIGAQMIVSGQISKRGLISPVWDVPYDRCVDQLAKRGVEISLSLS